MTERSFIPRMTLAVLGVLGTLNALYLSLHRWQPQTTAPLQCGVIGNCQAVQASPYSVFPPTNGIPVAYIGLIGFVGLLLLSVLHLSRERLGSFSLATLTFALATLGLAFSGYLTAIEAWVLHEWCQWCIISASLMFVFWLVAGYDWRLWRTNQGAEAAPDSVRHEVMI